MQVYFELSITINRHQQDVFLFLRDKDKYEQKKDSPVLILEKTTEGPVGVGTRYREVVQMLPFFRGEIISVITHYEPPLSLEEDFSGAGMTGHLAYQFQDKGDKSELIQRESIDFIFPLKIMNPLIYKVLHKRLIDRLNDIKTDLES